MSTDKYDLAVIGAGPGGYVAAIRAAQLGMRVACIERDTALGGTCLNIGCIPSKALLESSERYHEVAHGLGRHGIKVAGVELDLATMMKRKNDVVRALTKGVAGLFKKNGVEHVLGTARITPDRRVEVTREDVEPFRVASERILIATGSEPVALKGLPFDGRRVISSTEALSLPAVPRRMLVVGAGAVGLELGSVWSRLGAEVTVVELMGQVVPGADADVARALQSALEKQGLTIRLATTVESGAVDEDGVRVTLKSGAGTGDDTFDVALVSIGRRPYTAGLGLEEAGIDVDEHGRVRIDQHYRTSVPGVFAIGDVVAGPMLAHKAEEEGVACVERIAGIAGHVDYDAIPSVVYTWPELASVGVSEAKAKEDGREVRVGSFPFRANGRARCMGDVDGLVKIVADRASDRVLGIHIVGPNASELIAEAAVAMEFSAAAEDLARSVHAHPTLAEAIKEAALAVDGRAIHI